MNGIELIEERDRLLREVDELENSNAKLTERLNSKLDVFYIVERMAELEDLLIDKNKPISAKFLYELDNKLIPFLEYSLSDNPTKEQKVRAFGERSRPKHLKLNDEQKEPLIQLLHKAKTFGDRDS